MHFSTVSWNTVHLLANWHSGAKKILKVRQVLGTTNSKVWMLLKRVGLKIALSLYNGTFGDQMTKWGQNYSFPHSAYTMVHLVAHLTWPSGKVGQKLQFSTISMYNGTFGGPLTKWCQKFHFSPVCLYYGTFGGPLTKWCQKLHFSPISLYYGTFGGPLTR